MTIEEKRDYLMVQASLNSSCQERSGETK